MGTCFCTGACRDGRGCAAAGIPPSPPTLGKQVGWTCPKGHSVSPWESTCPLCSVPEQSWAGRSGCNHSFAFHMVVPPEGAWITCPICGALNFVIGTAAYM